MIIWAITRIFPRSRSRPDEPGASGDADTDLDRRLVSGEIEKILTCGCGEN